MATVTTYNSQWYRWGRVIGAIGLLFLMLSLSGQATLSASAPKVQPILAQLAVERPAEAVGVIVQKAVTIKDGRVEALVSQLGGHVTRDLHIINAFVAELKAQDVPQLAQADGVRWISWDAPVQGMDCSSPCIDTSNLQSLYPHSANADKVWNFNANTYYQGQGVNIAVVDSGIANHPDLNGRVIAQVKFNAATTTTSDLYGHGTHVAGIIGGDGTASNGAYIGIAPKANLINVKVSSDLGSASASDVINGLQWINDNRSGYNIKVVNLSASSSVNQSYNVDPIDAAIEILWFNRIVVVVAAGNLGKNDLYPPANDPFVITVGALDDKGTVNTGDDKLAKFSAYGTTIDGFNKPDLIAPGTNLISLLASQADVLATQHPDHLVSGFSGAQSYFRMSGTSMSAPVVAGAVALLLQSNPDLTPDQVKYRLMNTATPLGGKGTGTGYLNIYNAVNGTSTATANTGTPASQLLWTGSTPVAWDSVNWTSVNWTSVNWTSVNWTSVNWTSVNWTSDDWGQ